MTGRRPTWSDSPPTVSSAASRLKVYTAYTRVIISGVRCMDCWYSRYSGVTALLLATTSAAPTKLKTVMTAGERVRRRTARGGAGRDDAREPVGMTESEKLKCCVGCG